MNVFAVVRRLIIEMVNELGKDGKLPKDMQCDAVTAEPPKDAAHGDIATNVAMVLAKQAKMKPRDIAELVAAKLEKRQNIAKVDIAGPGFINIHLDPAIWADVITDILESKVGYGNSNIGNSEPVNVEYVSANPTGPMHIGHARGAVFGDALSLLLIRAGYDVTKEYYINDAGAQIDVLAKSAYLRYKEALGEDIGEIPEGLYPGDYLKIVGEGLVREYDYSLTKQDEKDWLPIVKDYALESMMALIRDDLLQLGIEHDVFTSERAVQESGKIVETLAMLQEKGLIYKGVLEPPKGMKPDDWEEREQTLFKSSQFGDDLDRAIKKSDGSWTYFAADIAYHLDKYQRGFNHMVIMLGADHGGYIKRLKAVVKAISDEKADIDVKICQLVNFLDKGEPVKMSKRAGTFTTVRDVVDLVGKDVVRFIMLTRKNDAPLDFDLTAVKEQSKDNPIFYVQYAHTRAKSVLRKAIEEAKDAVKLANNIDKKTLMLLNSPDEQALIKRMAQWPRLLEAAALAHEPHRVAFYLQDLAAEFHALWNKGQEETVLRFILPDNPEVTAARLAMLRAMTYVIASGLMIFNIEPLNEM